MDNVHIIVSVSGEDTGLLVGQYSRLVDLPAVPTEGDWIHIAGESARIQDVVWFIDTQGFVKVEL